MTGFYMKCKTGLKWFNDDDDDKLFFVKALTDESELSHAVRSCNKHKPRSSCEQNLDLRRT